MLATSHLLWSAVWYGIAVNAVSRAQAFVRAAARKSPGVTPPGALRLAEAVNLLQLVKSNTIAGLKEYEAAKADPDRLSSMGFAVAMNNVKIASSETILAIINQAMLICGIMGDAHSAQLMISNDRILGNTSNLLLVHKQDTSLIG
jgi:acyl-CoA dehydrogenase